MDGIGKKILLVDDEKYVVDSLRIALGKFSSEYKPYTAANGAEAIDVLKSVDIDLVITDLNMPVMDGFEFLAYMSRHFSSIPVIVLSGHITSEAREVLSVSDPVLLIDKPVRLNKLFSAIEAGLNRGVQEDFVKGLTLGNFLQLVAIEQKSCVLEILSAENSHKGYFYFDQGLLKGAFSNVLFGDDSVVEMMAWNDVEIRIKNLMPMSDKYKTRNDLTTFIKEARKSKKEERENEEKQGIYNEVDGAVEGDLPEETTSEKRGYQKKVSVNETGSKNHGNQTGNLKRNDKIDFHKLNRAVEKLKADLGNGLIAADVWRANDGQSIAGYKGESRVCSLFNQLTDDLVKGLMENNYPGLGKYYILDLDDGSIVIVLPFSQCRAGIRVDSRMVQLGLLLNIIIPQLIDNLEEAVMP